MAEEAFFSASVVPYSGVGFFRARLQRTDRKHTDPAVVNLYLIYPTVVAFFPVNPAVVVFCPIYPIAVDFYAIYQTVLDLYQIYRILVDRYPVYPVVVDSCHIIICQTTVDFYPSIQQWWLSTQLTQ